MAGSAKIALRVADVDDVERIHDMLAGLARAVGDQDKMISAPGDLRQHGFGDTPAFHALLAEQEGRAVGLSLYFYSYSTWLGRLGVYIQDLYVDDAARGTGLGQRLVERTASLARARGANHLRLSVYNDNTGAQAFYRRIGMRHRDEELIYQADGPVFDILAGAADTP